MSVSEIDEHISRRYNIRKRLGKGAYGIVWKAIDRRTNRIVAVKKIFDAFRNPTDAQRTFREIMFLQEFGNHTNIIKLLGIHRATNNRDIYLIFEHMDTDLHNVIRKGNILQIIHIKFIMYQLLKATKFIHSGNVIHRDQKPSNILLNSNCLCKIADFGLARSMSQLGGTPDGSGEKIIDPTLTDYVATRWYRAPEILVASKRYTQGIDMWSLGCILAEMLLGKPLFPGTSTINQIDLILAAVPPLSQEDMSSVSSNFGSSLLQKAPSLPRQSLQKLLSHAPVDAVDLISKLLVFNPLKRLTASQALQHPFVSSFHQGEEPVMNHVVLPPLRDDVQLSVDDYRNKLYEMMVKPHFRNIRPNHDNGTRNLLHSQSQLIQPVSRENHLRKMRHVSVETLTPPPLHRGTVASQTQLSMSMHRGNTLSRSSKGSKTCQIPRPIEIIKTASNDHSTQRHEEQPKLIRQNVLHRPVHLHHPSTMKNGGNRQINYLKSENTVLPAAVRVFKNNRNIKQLQQCKRSMSNTNMGFYNSQHSNNVRVYSW